MHNSEGNLLVRLLPSEDPGRYGIVVRPRWPYREVLVTAPALEALCAARQRIAAQSARINLVVIRGYETVDQTLRRNRLRGLGRLVFGLLYPWRRQEIAGIFSPNGHDCSGNHVDVRFDLEGRAVNLLPLGPLTPLAVINGVLAKYETELEIVWGALRECGFRIHPNISEALQIHCDL